MNLQEGMEIVLTTGEVFILDNEMKTSTSCTMWDVYRFDKNGLLKEVTWMGLVEKIKSCKTMPELDRLRLEIVTKGKSDVETFKLLQREFIKKKNQLNRIPLFERDW